jgi:hypothetical protein
MKTLEKHNRHAAWLLIRSILQIQMVDNWILSVYPRIRYELSPPCSLKPIYQSEPLVLLARLDALFPKVELTDLPEQLLDYPNELHAIVSILKPIQITQPRPTLVRGLSNEDLQDFINNDQKQTVLLKDGIALKAWADGSLGTDVDDVFFAVMPDIRFNPEATIAYRILNGIVPFPVFGLMAMYV